MVITDGKPLNKQVYIYIYIYIYIYLFIYLYIYIYLFIYLIMYIFIEIYRKCILQFSSFLRAVGLGPMCYHRETLLGSGVQGYKVYRAYRVYRVEGLWG